MNYETVPHDLKTDIQAVRKVKKLSEKEEMNGKPAQKTCDANAAGENSSFISTNQFHIIILSLPM